MPNWPALVVPEDWKPGTGEPLGGVTNLAPSTESDVSAQPTGVDIAAHMSGDLGVVPPLLPDHIAAHVAPDLGVSLVGDQTGKPVVDAAHHIAASVAPDLKVDVPPPTGVSQAEHIAQSVAPDFGVDFAPTVHPDNPMAVDNPRLQQNALERAAASKRIEMGIGTPGDYAQKVARGAAAVGMAVAMTPIQMAASLPQVADIPRRAIEGAEAYKAGVTEPPVGPAADTAALLAGSRILGAPEEGLSLGAGPAGKAPKYSLKNPPPKTASLPDVKALSDPYLQHAHAVVSELDAANPPAPDDAYRTGAFSAGSKEMKSNGQPKDAPTWRDKIVNILNANASKAPQGTPTAARLPPANVPDFGAAPREAPANASPASPEFKQWFSGSKVVDPKGNPLVVYRGTTGEGPLESKRGIYYFSADPEYATGYSRTPSTTGEVHKAYLNLQNPKIIKATENAQTDFLNAESIKALEKQGYDGVINYSHENYGDTRAPAKEIIAFHPEQVRFIGDEAAAPREASAGGGRQPPEPPAPPSDGTGEPPDFGKELGDVAKRNVAADRLPPKMKTATVTEMEDDLHRLRTGAQADRAEAENFMKTLPEATGKRDAELYRIGENKPLQTDADFQKYGKPLADEELRLINRLRDLTGDKSLEYDPEYMHRMVQGRTPRMDEAIGAEEPLPYKGFRRSLSTGADANKGRTILALDDGKGNRKVITEYPGGDAVYTWDKGKPTQLKAGQFGEYGGFIRRVPEHEVGGQEIPWRRTIDRPVVAKAQGGRINLGYTKKGGREIPAHTTPERIVPERVIPGEFKVGDEFHDKDNKVWQIKQAKTDEIERAGVRTTNAKGQLGEPITYHKSFFSSKLTNITNLRRAVRNAEFLDKWKQSPAFKAYARPLEGMSEADRADLQKQGWTTVDYPGWRDHLYDRRFAEPLNDFFKGIGNSPTMLGQALEKANSIATGSMFWTGIGSLAHGRNELSMSIPARGFANLDPRTAKWFGRAFDEVRQQGPLYIQALREGASFPSAGMKPDSLEAHLLKYVGEKVASADPASLKEAAVKMGLDAKDYLRAIEQGMSRGVFKLGDMLMMEHIIRQMDKGYSLREAIDDAEKYLPTYRLRSRTGGTGKLARMTTEALGSKNITQFGRFEKDKAKFWYNLVADSATSLNPASKFSKQQRIDTAGRVMATAVFATLVPWAINNILQNVTGDKNAHINLGGAMGWMQSAIRAFQQIKSGRETTAHVLYDFMNGTTNMAPFMKEFFQQISTYQGMDWFTGKPISESNPTLVEWAKERGKHAAGTMFAPANLAYDPMKALREPFGISVAKPFSDRPRTLGQEKRQYYQDLRTRNR